MRKKIHLLFLWGVLSLFSSMAYAEEESLPKPIFKLTKGQGTEVCDAYLQRLNNSDYRRISGFNFLDPPFCGRPEDDSVPGFTRLNRMPLNAGEIYALQASMHRFQHDRKRKYRDFAPLESVKSVQRFMDTNRLGAWRYNPPVDIDNDGQADNVLIWFSAAGAGGCGSFNGNDTYPEGGSYTANILDAKNQAIDEKRTEELFGHPVGGYPNTVNGKFLGFYDNFRYVGTSMGIFAYQGSYYFDTFFDGWGDFNGKRVESYLVTHRKGKRIITEEKYRKFKQPTHAILGVFQRKKGKTKQICEYYWTNWHDLESKH